MYIKFHLSCSQNHFC